MKYALTAILLSATAVLCAQTNLTIEGKTYTNSDDTWMGVVIPRSNPTALYFKNNAITSSNTAGYMLQAGDESIGSTNNNLDGAVITGNKFIWKGTDMKSITHGLFTGHNVNVIIKYNYLDRVPMGIIRKSTNNMTNTSGRIAYNIVKSPNVGIVVKGMSGVSIYNNTLYQDRTTSETGRGLIDVYTNHDISPVSVSHNTKIYNNIFYTRHQTLCVNVMDRESLTGLECDYNIYYCETGSPKFNAGGSIKTFDEWQAMGYDTHSKVINPNFKDFTSFVPAARLDYGTDLGSAYATGLSVDAKWGTTSPATATQNGKWQVGAVIYKEVITTVPVPVYSGSVINDASPARLEMTYSLTLANIVPAASSFNVTVNGSSRSVSAVSVSGTKVLLTLSSPVSYGDKVTVAYTRPSTNPLQTSSGGQAASFTAKDVTNNVAAPVPVYVNSVIDNASPSVLVMTYNMALANIVPAASSFSVRVNSTARTVSSVAVSGTKVTLTLASPVVYGDVVTVAYTKPSSNPLQTSAGGQAASFSAKTVTNNLSAPANSPPLINISSPTKSTAFIAPATITIDASASDPDGVVTKVEFYNGTAKLGERTSAPWSYTWKEVEEGSYTITAAATDNSGSRTVSSAVTVVVEKAAPAVNLAPSIAIATPLNNVSFEAPATVTLTADATDPDGSITRVEYLAGGVKIGESFVPPFTFTFQCDTAGIFEITAVAWDNLNASATSTPVTISFNLKREIPDLVNLYPSPNNGVFTIEFNPLPETVNDNRLTILSLTGKTVCTCQISDEETYKYIDISDAVPGIYIMQITGGNRVLTTKTFIKY
jgi:uncharacterized repeat protein (TIGR02059 family)